MIKTIYFVRHGESIDNAAPVFQAKDSPLSKLGRTQAKHIAVRASQLDFESLISSPLQRAKETATIIAEATDKEPEYAELFVERIKPTSVGGKPHADKEANALWRKWEKSLSTPGLRAADGENYTDIVVRADKALAFLESRPEQSMLVVTHGYFLRTLAARILLGDHLSPAAFKNFQRGAMMENTGLTVFRHQPGFEEDPSWRLWIYNDHAHLADRTGMFGELPESYLRRV